jgi:hypothetical protein
VAGQVPGHWEVKKLKFSSRLFSGVSLIEVRQKTIINWDHEPAAVMGIDSIQQKNKRVLDDELSELRVL